MYLKEEVLKLQALTRTLLAAAKNGIKPAQIDDLRNVLKFHEYRYYIENDPLLADGEYDQLYKSLEQIEAENPSLITPDSPTQRVATVVTKEFFTAPHLVPMLSLENSYNEDDLRDWDRKAREMAGLKDIEYCVEPKFDGASISLVYENDHLFRGLTRGDGIEGDDITTNIKQVRSVPLSAPFSKYGIQQIEIRGEVLLTKANFKKYNDWLATQNLAPLANPRNAAAGSLRIKDALEVRRRNLEAFLYHVSYVLHSKKDMPEQLTTHGGSLKFLWDLGFRSPEKEKKVVKGIEKVIAYCREYEAKRDDLPYEIDGMVIKVNDLELQDKLGMTTHHPRWAIAFKFKARQATSKLLNVEFQVGRTGSITPVAKINPVPIGGVVVGSISLFNEEVIREKDLLIGDTVLVERAGDVIPYIVKSLADVRNGTEKKIKFPTKCPACGDPLVKPEGEAAWRCININCPAQVVERIIHFASKDAMDIRGFGDALVKKFYDLGFIKDVPGIYRLPFDKIRELEGFGEKSIVNLSGSIEKSKSQPLHRLIYAMGIRFVGETTAKVLANSVAHLSDLKKFTEEDLLELEDIGPKVAGSIYQFFHNKDNVAMLEQLEKVGVSLQNTKKQHDGSGNLSGMTFLFTGTLPTLKRTEAEELVEQNGGKLLGSVSSKLTYLVAGEDAGSKLEKAKKIGSVRIIAEHEFLKLINK
ncbi:MAG: NAD-dependent DNA ligase LigA [Chitinophagaceae bacterium]|nr:NAD-dependent DNA ligase LigA [Chitinophagaceae bacterium]